MALSSGLRLGRAPERNVDDEKLEISITSQKSYRKQSDTHVDSPRWSKPPERQSVVLVEWVIFPIATTDKKLTFLPELVGRGEIENH